MTMDMSASGIVVEENSGAPQSPVDEAAILYSSGQFDMAERLLQGVLATGDRRAWHMLFDLYCVQSREREFEQLALDYAMRFETSPPVWQKLGGNSAAKPYVTALSLWAFVHGVIQIAATKAGTMAHEGVVVQSFVDHAIALALRSLQP